MCVCLSVCACVYARARACVYVYARVCVSADLKIEPYQEKTFHVCVEGGACMCVDSSHALEAEQSVEEEKLGKLLKRLCKAYTAYGIESSDEKTKLLATPAASI